MSKENNGKPLIDQLLSSEDTSGGLLNMPIVEQDTSGNLGVEPLGKYDKGLVRGMDQQQNRIQNQTFGQTLGNAMVQTLSELTLGTLEGAGYLVDLQSHYNTIMGTEQEFGNAFTELMKSAKEDVADAFPTHPAEGFKPTDTKWWVANLPSIASSLSLLIPSRAAAIGISKLASGANKLTKGAVALDKLTKTASFQGVSSAIASRMMENMMEAGEVASTVYNEEIEKGATEEEAKEKAGLAGRNTYMANTAMLPIDMAQYMTIVGPFSSVVKEAAKQKSLLKRGLTSTASVVSNAAGEGAEEAFQFAVGKQAGESSSSMETIFNALAAIPGYRNDPEFKKSVTLGAAGGAVFDVAGKGIEAIYQRLEKIQDYVSKGEFHKADQESLAQAQKMAKDDPDRFRDFIEEGKKDPTISDRERQRLEDLSKALEDGEDVTSFSNTPEELKEQEKEVATQESFADRRATQYENQAKEGGNQNYDEKQLDAIKLSALKELHKGYSKEKKPYIEQQIKEIEEKYKDTEEGVPTTHGIPQGSTFRRVKNDFANAGASKATALEKANTLKEIENKPEETAEKLRKETEKQREAEEIEAINTTRDPERLYQAINDPVSKKTKEIAKELYKTLVNEELSDASLLPKDQIVHSGDFPFLNHFNDKYLRFPKILEAHFNEKPEIVPETEYNLEGQLGIVKETNEDTTTIILNEGEEVEVPTEKLQEDIQKGNVNPFGEVLTPTEEDMIGLSDPDPDVEAIDNSQEETPPIVSEEVTEALSDPTPEPVTEIKASSVESGDPHLLALYDKSMAKGKAIRLEDGTLKQDDRNEIFLSPNAHPDSLKILRSFGHEFPNWETFDVFFEVDKDVLNLGSKTPRGKKFIQNMDESNIPIVAVVYVDGKRIPIGVVRSQKKYSGKYPDNLKALRRDLWNKFNNERSNRDVRIVQSDRTTKISNIYKGQYWNVQERKPLNNQAVINRYGIDGKIYLAVSDFEGLKAPDIPEKIQSKIIDLDNPSPGMTYMLIPTARGNYSWAKVKTLTAEEHAPSKEEILSILNKAQQAQIDGKAYKEQNPKAKFKDIKENVATVADWYNNWSDYRTKLQSIIRFREQKSDGTYKLDPDFNEKLFTISRFQEGGIFSPTKFYESKQLGLRPLQIDASKINQGNYNNSVGERLLTDLSLEAPYHSPSFVVNPYSNQDSVVVKQEETTKKKKFNVKGIKPPEFRARLLKSGNIGKLNKEQATQWLRQRLPDNLSIEIVNGFVQVAGMNAWGVTYNALIKLSKFSSIDTVYHEAFHVVFNNMLTPVQRKQLLDQARKRYNLNSIDISNAQKYINQLNDYYDYKKLPHTTITAEELALEEKLADEFMEYVAVQDKLSLPQKISQFFKNLLSWIKQAITNKAQIDNLFNQINRGSFQGRPFVSEFFDPKLQEVNLSNEKKKAVVNLGLNYLDRLIQDREQLVKEYKGLLSKDPEKNVLTNLSDPTKSLPLYILGNIGEANNPLEIIDVLNQLRPGFEIDSEGEITHNGSEEIGPLYDEIVRNLSSRGVIVSLKGDVNQSNAQSDTEVEFDESDDTREQWSLAELSISPKENLTARLKRLISNIETGEASPFGETYLKPTYDANEIYPKLQRVIGNSISVNDMLNKLQNSNQDFALKIYEQISRGNENPATSTVATELFIHVGQKIHPDYKVVLVDDGQVKFISSNRFTLNKVLLSDLAEQFDVKHLDFTIKNIPEKVLTKENKEKGEVPMNLVQKINKGLGLTIEDNVIQSIGTIPYITSLHNALKKYKRTEKFEDSFTNLTKLLAKHTPQEYQDAHLNVEGKRVYEWQNSNYIGRLINKLNGNRAKTRAELLRDPAYQNLPLLTKFDNHQFELVVIDGIKKDGQRKGNKYSNFSDTDMLYTLLGAFRNQGSKKEAYISLPILSDSPNLSFVKVPKYETTDAAINDVVQAIEYEKVRKGRKQNIKNYDKNFDKSLLYGELDGGNVIQTKINVKKRVNELTIQTLDLLNSKGIQEFKEEDVRLFVANHLAHHPQLMLLSSGDPAFYKAKNNIGDYYKRAKEIFSPGQYINTSAHYESPTDGIVKVPKTFKLEIAPDIEIPATQLKEITDSLTKAGYAKVAKQYEKVTLTDAQTYIDPVAYRHREIGLGRWNSQKEKAYQNLMSGKVDTTVTFQPFKPFYYSIHNVNGQNVPTQKKDSEFLILPIYGLETINGKPNPMYNPEFKSMLTKMGYSFKDGKVTYKQASRQIDGFTFDTTIKVGRQNYTKDQPLVQEFNYSDWRLQQEVPEHHKDTDDIFGTQIMKLITADLDPNTIYTLPNGEKYTAQELVKQYESNIIRRITASHSQLEQRIIVRDSNGIIDTKATYSKLIETLREEVIQRGLGDQYLKALEEVEPGKTALPLWHPLHSYRIESIINSIFKNAVTKQKFENGFSFVNTSAYGFKKQPKIVFKEDGSIDHFEAYIPIHSSKLEKYIDPDTGLVDIESIAEEDQHLLRGIVYRIPTEDKYSMFNIKIVGFLPGNAGAIILPHEVTQIAGLDFDIDKVRGFFYGENEVENRTIDLMRAVLENPATIPNQLIPGGYENLSKNNDKITKLTGYNEDLDYLDPSTLVNVASRMNAGKALIGVAANNNASHALMQHADTLRMNYPLTYDGQELTEINRLEDIEGSLVSKNFAENLAAYVDNGKDPQADKFNMNSFTADVGMLMLHLGLPLSTMQMFLANKSVRDFTKFYFDNGGNQQAFDKALTEFKVKNQRIDKKVELPNLAQMEKDINKFNEKYLTSFLILKKRAEKLADFIRAIKVADAGPGVTSIQNMSKVRKLSQDHDKHIEGASSLLYAGYLKAFNDYSLNRAIDYSIDQAGFPNLQGDSFNKVVNFMEQLNGRTLSDDQLKNYVEDMYHYMASGFEFFKYDPEVEKKLPQGVKQGKKIFPKNKFLKRLTIKSNQVEFKSSVSDDNFEIQMIREDFHSLKTEAPRLFNDLIRYSFYRNGFKLSYAGFSHLHPVDFYTNLQDSQGNSFNDYLEDQFSKLGDNNSNLNHLEFNKQYILNNYTNLGNTVPSVVKENTDFISDNLIKTKEYRYEGENNVKLLNPYIKHKGKLYHLYDYENGIYRAIKNPSDNLKVYDNSTILTLETADQTNFEKDLQKVQKDILGDNVLDEQVDQGLIDENCD